MYLAIDTARVDNNIKRLASLIRRFDDIHGRFASLSRQIDLEVRNRETVRIALRSLENDLESIRKSLKKMHEITEDIVAEYLGAHSTNLRDCSDLSADIGTISQKTSVNDRSSDNDYQSEDYIGQINESLIIPISITTPIDAETLERYGMKATESDFESNVAVPVWRIPVFK